MAKPKLGDVLEIDGDDGLMYYAQYTHQHPMFGALLRVRAIKSRPGEETCLSEILSRPIALSIFYPLRRSLKEGIFKVIGNQPLTGDVAVFPIFRDGHENPRTGRVEEWWLWDGEREWFVGALDSPEKYPLRQIVNDTLLRELVRECVG